MPLWPITILFSCNAGRRPVHGSIHDVAYNVAHGRCAEATAGGTVVKEPQKALWGGYHANFADLEGYFWEVVWGLDFRLDDNGLLLFSLWQAWWDTCGYYYERSEAAP